MYASGERSIKEAAVLCGVKPSTFFEWVYTDVDKIADRYMRAQGIRALALRDDILPILDDSRNDWVEKRSRDGSTFVVLNPENIRRSEMRANYRMKFAAENLPRNLGGLSDATGEQQIVIRFDQADAAV